MTFAASTLPEEEFIRRMAEESDCGLLLDVNNVYVTCRNHDLDPDAYLDGIPYDRVVQIHLAGHTDRGDYVLDTHDNYVCDEVWQIYADVYPQTQGVSTLLEWDENFVSFQETWDEALKAKEFQRGLVHV